MNKFLSDCSVEASNLVQTSGQSNIGHPRRRFRVDMDIPNKRLHSFDTFDLEQGNIYQV